MQTNHGNHTKGNLFNLSKTVSFVLIPLLLLKLLAVEHAHHIEIASLLNTVIISLTRKTSIVD